MSRPGSALVALSWVLLLFSLGWTCRQLPALGKSQMENLLGSSGSPQGPCHGSFLLMNDSERSADTDPITITAPKFALCFPSAPARQNPGKLADKPALFALAKAIWLTPSRSKAQLPTPAQLPHQRPLVNWIQKRQLWVMGLKFHQGFLGRSQTPKSSPSLPPPFLCTVPKQNYSPIIQRGSVCLQEDKCKEPSGAVNPSLFLPFFHLHSHSSSLSPSIQSSSPFSFFSFLIETWEQWVSHCWPFTLHPLLSILTQLLHPIYSQLIPWHKPDCKLPTHIKPPHWKHALVLFKLGQTRYFPLTAMFLMV